MLGTGLALVARHAAQRPLVAFVAAPLCAFLSPSGAPPPLQSACALALTLLEVARLAHGGAAELVLSAVAVGLLLLAPRVTPPAPLANALACACAIVAARYYEPITTDVAAALLALDFGAAYVSGPYALLLLLAPVAAAQVLPYGVATTIARWGLLPALLLGAHAHARALRQPAALYAIAAATVLALCAQGDPFLEMALLALHAGARWLARQAQRPQY
jgi:hypothetical protein